MTCSTLEDPRPIVSVTFLSHTEDMDWWEKVGRNGVTKIEVYPEMVEYDPDVPRRVVAPWIAIWKGDHLCQRIGAHNLLIEYGE